MGRLKFFFAALAVCLPFAAQSEAVLLMAEEDGCIYCARWNAEVGDAYDKTAEGKAAREAASEPAEPSPNAKTLAAWLALPALWAAARGRVPAPWQRFFMLLLPAVALIGTLAPIWQANLHHLLFWLPAHAALAWSALQSRVPG